MPRPWLAAAAGAFAATLLCGAAMRRAYAPRLPPLSGLVPGPFAFQDAALAVSGFRAPAADLAWVQLLQYAAGNLPEYPDGPGHGYDRIGELSLRVARLDPSFHHAILFGAGILGWFEGVERPDEAVELLREGMRWAPEQPLYALYIAALAYKKRGQSGQMIDILEASFDDPNTPSLMKTILANLRQARGERRRALWLWERILASERDASEHARARLKIAELRALPRGAPPPHPRQQ